MIITDDPQECGTAFGPTGMVLIREACPAIAGEIASELIRLCEQTADTVVDIFEFADSTTTEVDPEEGRASIGIDGSTYGAIDRFDHPIVSLFGTDFVGGLETPVTVIK